LNVRYIKGFLDARVLVLVVTCAPDCHFG